MNSARGLRALGGAGAAYRGRVWRFVLARRWWVGHVLIVLCCGLFVRLGRWQWDRAQSPTGGWQNLGYALQWPLFAVVLVVAWGRFLWLEQHRGAELSGTGPVPDLNPPVPWSPEQPPQSPTRPPNQKDDPDDELAAYNDFLAQLAEQDRRYG
jgi:DNA-binding transcriptional regulator of glucitol operon